MSNFELVLCLKRLTKSDTVACVKRIGQEVLKRRGILRKVEYMGTKALPYKFKDPHMAERTLHQTGSYFLLHADWPPQLTQNMNDFVKLDRDVIRHAVMMKNAEKIPQDYECTLEEELLPPALRPSVQKLIAEGEMHKVKHPIRHTTPGTFLSDD